MLVLKLYCRVSHYIPNQCTVKSEKITHEMSSKKLQKEKNEIETGVKPLIYKNEAQQTPERGLSKILRK